MGLICSASDLDIDKQLTWYKIDTYEEDQVYNSDMDQVNPNSRIGEKKYPKMRAQLYISKVEVADSGIYYCKIGDIWGPGTALQVISKCAFMIMLFRTGLYTIFIIYI